MEPDNAYQFWEGLDLTVMPDGGEDLIPNPTETDVLDYIEAFCRQLDYGIGSPTTLVQLMTKPETMSALQRVGSDYLTESPNFGALCFLLGLGWSDPGPPNPWDLEPEWEKQDRLEGRPFDNSPV
jgi:hypothetical protein